MIKPVSYYNNLPVLITGGCGFIGSHLAHVLLNYGAQITIVDDLSTGTLDAIADISTEITFIHGDIRDESVCRQAAANKAIVFHCAAFISAPDSCIYPFECFDINVNGTANLLNVAHHHQVKRFIFSSSAAVYGEKSLQLKEDDPCQPTSPYGYSKLMGELLCKQYAYNYGMTTIILRYFNVWGEKQNPHSPYAGVIARFLYNLRNNLPTTIYGDGTQTRDFIHVNDIVQANVQAGFWPDHLTGQEFNIATGKSRTLLEIFTELKQQFPDYNQPLQFIDKRTGDITHSYADCTKYYSTMQELN